MATEPAVLFGSTSDGPTAIDTLGFTPYVDSVAKFLESPNTQPPLTISIEGEWGSGKSSFMLQLKNQLCKMSGTRVAIDFNAWRHDKDDSLWAAFALKCARDLRSNIPLRQRATGWIHLNWLRINGLRGWIHFSRLLTITLLWFCLLLAGPTLIILKGKIWTQQTLTGLMPAPISSPTPSPKAEAPSAVIRAAVWLFVHGGALGLWAAIMVLGGSQLKKLGNPLEADLEKIVTTPGYEGKVEFIDQFHEDFKKVLDAYVGERRVYIFIDDLDRCDVPKAADLMRALNLMIDDDKRMVFILGMDREKVAAGIAAKYATILQYMNDDQDNPSPDKLAFGYHFLEKFIQIQYRLPQPRLTSVRALVGMPRTLQPTSRSQGAVPDSGTPDTVSVAAASLEAAEHTQQKADPLSIERKAVELLLDRDADAVYIAAEMVAPVFNFNPRRIKQFLNLFRLSAFISNGLGLFDWVQDEPVMTFEQLAKFVAISMIWPSFISLLEADRSLLEQLHRISLTTTPETETGWLKVKRFRYLLRYGLHDTDGGLASDAAIFSLEHLDVEPLLAVTTPIVRPRLAPRDSSPSEFVTSRVEAAAEAAAAAESTMSSPAASSKRERAPVEDQLEELARRYEETRETMSPGDERTASMSAIIRRTRSLANEVENPLLPARMFTEPGRPGDRVVALGLARALPAMSGYIPMAVEGIMRAQSPFEQYQALSLATQLVDIASAHERRQLLEALSEQQGVRIDQSDSSRWELRERLMELVRPSQQ